MDFIYFLGRLHVLALHLPIGIICVLFVLEWLVRNDKHRALAGALPFLWGAAAVTAILTVALGYMHFAEGGFTGPSAYLHRNFGTGVAVVTTAVAALRLSPFADAYKPLFFPAAALLFFLVAVTGHYGGNLTHGESFLVEHAPQVKPPAGLADPAETAALMGRALGREGGYTLQLRPFLERLRLGRYDRPS